MNELTNSNRRRKKSKDFKNSPLASVFEPDKEETTPTTSPAPTNEEVKEEKAPVVEKPTEEKAADIFSDLPKKTSSTVVNSSNGLLKSSDGKYVLKQNTIYHKVKKLPRTISIREDIAKILDEVSLKPDGSGSYARGVKASILNNAIIKELYSMGKISKEDMMHELEPYE
ncbi:hypothetical protein [Liquorilactobacillus mali]|uniref:Uncharacterized protein n=1 Tax=Liquorilactobacillus mali KCTC 3596 = DSM 20444 TaxID=1046596 RepID=A0A0R2EDD8_9LACO|nr:hypothetical protein [Liquorilactobacillus mali]KRN10810.1 hypothetical protein FD00_GL002053 [Liquorilactobacillus mali KCTC 3596 = DSM 20444]